MLNEIIADINTALIGFDKTYCLVEWRDRPQEYTDSGNFRDIPYDSYPTGGYWRRRGETTVSYLQGNAACSRIGIDTIPLYFVAWTRRDRIDPDSFSDIVRKSIESKAKSLSVDVLSINRDALKDEFGVDKDNWFAVRFNVNIVTDYSCVDICTPITRCDRLLSMLTVNEITTCVIPNQTAEVIFEGIENAPGPVQAELVVLICGSPPDGNIELNGVSVGSVASGATRDIDVLQDGLPVGSWNGTEWIVPTPEPCPLGWSVENSLEQTIISGIINDPCVEPSLTIPIGDISYRDCDGVLQTVPYPNVPDTIIFDASECVCDEVTLSVNRSPQLFTDLLGCPLELGISVLDQNDNPVGSWVGSNYVVEIPECETLCELIAPADWPTIKACMDAPQIAAATDDLCTACPYVRPNLTDHITLDGMNPFGNMKRFTGLTGGYKDAGVYYDAAGLVTTEALAFPFDMVLDWFGYNNGTVPAIEKSINTLITGGNFTTIVTPSLAALNASVYGGHSDWSLIDPLSGLRIGEYSATAEALNFPPFDQTVYTGITASLWSSQEYTFAPTQQYWVGLFPLAVATALKTQSRGAKAYRIYTFAELGL